MKKYNYNIELDGFIQVNIAADNERMAELLLEEKLNAAKFTELFGINVKDLNASEANWSYAYDGE